MGSNERLFCSTDGSNTSPLTFNTAIGTRYMPTENVSMADQVRHLLIATHSLTQKIMNSRVHVCDPEKFLNTNYSPQHFWVSCLNHTRRLFNWSIVMLIEKNSWIYQNYILNVLPNNSTEGVPYISFNLKGSSTELFLSVMSVRTLKAGRHYF